MTELEAIQEVYAQWIDGWTALHPSDPSDPNHVPFRFKGETFKPTADNLGALGAWARVTVLHTSSAQVTMGSAPYRKFERRGTVTVQLFAPIAQGVGLLAELADHARTVLEGQRLGELLLYEGRTVEPIEDGQWAMSAVVVRFRYIETR